MPLVAGSQSWGQEMRIEWPLKEQPDSEKNKAGEGDDENGRERTDGAGLGKRARKSFTPQESAATSPSRTELISDGYGLFARKRSSRAFSRCSVIRD